MASRMYQTRGVNVTELVCRVGGKNAMIVGYGPGLHGVPKAIVVVDGELRAVKLKHIQLVDLPVDLRAKDKSREKDRRV